MNYRKEDLISSENIFNEVNIDGYNLSTLINLYEKMFLIREVEKVLANGKKNGIIGGPIHLGVGQEAIAVGIANNLKKNDQVFGNHRSHSHILSLGTDLRKFFAEILGKENGVSKGRGGSMHMIDQSVGFSGSVPIVSGTLSVAVGAALASKLKKNNSVVVPYFGDGAVEEGIFHESLNFSRINSLPILFVAENNLFASHMHLSERQPSFFTSRFADAHLIEKKVIDGNNIIEINEVVSDFIERSRMGEGPFYLEAITFRWYGHVDWRDDIDVGINRSKTDILNWKKRDPIKRLKDSIIKNIDYKNYDFEKIEREILNNINLEWEKALNDPFPSSSSLWDNLYA